MIDATVRQGEPDLNGAGQLLMRGMNHAKSAAHCTDNESGYVLLYYAAHKAISAVLLAKGIYIESGERGHKVLISEAKNHFGADHAALLSRLDRARRKRNNVAYGTEEIESAELAAMTNDAKETLGAAYQLVQEQKQSPASD